jgi:subtilase family serine protease
VKQNQPCQFLVITFLKVGVRTGGESMKSLSVCSIGMFLLLAAPILMAQGLDGSHIYAHPTIRIADGPQDPSTPIGISPAQLKAAYGFNQIPNQGQGQTIALIDGSGDLNIESDLAAYKAQFHLGPCNFQKVTLGNPQGAVEWSLEEALDVEQACALAPQANIVLVESGSGTVEDLFAAVQVAYTQYNATVISMSWGIQEFFGQTAYDSEFCNAVTGNGQPVTFLVASGDIGHGTPSEYPATSPCVIAAGGTTLVLSTVRPLANPLALNYGVETAWNLSTGGVSRYESQPSFQNPACATWSTTNRCVPDISSDSNPNTGVPVYCTYGFGGWVEAAGTSLASPDWASFFTLVNSLRASQGKGPLSQANQDLYAIYYSSDYLNDFHDITSGSNGNCGSQCTASPGYDLVTGIGTYQANNLYSALVADPN